MAKNTKWIKITNIDTVWLHEVPASAGFEEKMNLVISGTSCWSNKDAGKRLAKKFELGGLYMTIGTDNDHGSYPTVHSVPKDQLMTIYKKIKSALDAKKFGGSGDTVPEMLLSFDNNVLTSCFATGRVVD
jgi:hypothetical protein